jgi:Ferredoxin
MAKVFIHYFSGTGNTKRAVDIITEDLKENQFEVAQKVIGKAKPVIIEKADFHIFAFSILSWSAPVFVKKYLHHLPQGQGERAAALAVYAGDPGHALLEVERLLRRKGYDIFLSGGATYLSNWSQMTNPPNVTESEEKLDAGDKMASSFSESFCKGEAKLFSKENSGSFLTRFSAFSFGLIGRRLLGKAYIADSNCNRCGVCVKSCPVHAISLAGMSRKKPHWNFNCEDCARCINICPKKAIQVSIPKLILHFLLLIAGITACFHVAGLTAGRISGIYSIFGWIAALVISLVIALWIQFAVIDRIIFVLEQIPGTKRFFEWGFTKKFNRYMAPGFKPKVENL